MSSASNYDAYACLLQALGGIIVLDILGVLRGWQFFDHAGHLGGVLFALYVGVV